MYQYSATPFTFNLCQRIIEWCGNKKTKTGYIVDLGLGAELGEGTCIWSGEVMSIMTHNPDDRHDTISSPPSFMRPNTNVYLTSVAISPKGAHLVCATNFFAHPATLILFTICFAMGGLAKWVIAELPTLSATPWCIYLHCLPGRHKSTHSCSIEHSG